MEKKRTKLLPEMEGVWARWYANLRGSQSQLDGYREQAQRLGLAAGTRLLEVAPGPGYFAIELARNGVDVTALDVSRTFVAIAAEKAKEANVKVDFRQGDVAAMPFGEGSFDMIFCQAAFKNFAEPGRALAEMHRVLRPGGVAIIEDMSKAAGKAEIAREVSEMRLSGGNALMTRLALTGLKRRAYTPERLREVVAASPFRTGQIETLGLSLRARLTKKASGR